MVVHLVVFHVLLALSLWSYAMGVLIDPGFLPEGFDFPHEHGLPRRYCQICHCFKPDRTHHCSMCRKCILGMSNHFSPFKNCMGLFNKKAIFLFFFYTCMQVLY